MTLRCSYDLEHDSLYTVKWYKGRFEFFRYTPKELPNTQVFPLNGISVDVSDTIPDARTHGADAEQIHRKLKCVPSTHF